MGHANFDKMIKISNFKAVRDLPKIIKPIDIVFKDFQLGKQTKRSFNNKEYYTTCLLEIIHIELCGPTRTSGINGERYFILLIDDYSRMTWVAFLGENLKLLKDLNFPSQC